MKPTVDYVHKLYPGGKSKLDLQLSLSQQDLDSIDVIAWINTIEEAYERVIDEEHLLNILDVPLGIWITALLEDLQ